MAKIVCTKCKATGWSKCPYCRTTFVDNEWEGTIGNNLKVTQKKDSIEITYISFANTGAEALEQALKNLQLAKEKVGFKQYGCIHAWVFAEGEKSSIDCGCK